MDDGRTDRSRRGSVAPPPGARRPAEGRAPARREGPCPARHCWVADAADGHGVRRPGLLVEWRQHDTAWQGRVVYAVRIRAASWALVEEWVPAALLTPL